jgi:hypothetical protein
MITKHLGAHCSSLAVVERQYHTAQRFCWQRASAAILRSPLDYVACLRDRLCSECARSVAASLQISPFHLPPDCDPLGWSYSTLSKRMDLRTID